MSTWSRNQNSTPPLGTIWSLVNKLYCLYNDLKALIAGYTAPVYGQLTVQEFRDADTFVKDSFIVTDEGLQGLFVYDPDDTTSADDGINVLVKNNKRYIRKGFGEAPYFKPVSESQLVISNYRKSGTTYYGLISQFTGSEITANITTTKLNGSPIVNSDVDNIIFFKFQDGNFGKRVWKNNIVTPEEFGAKADGVTNDYTAWSKMIIYLNAEPNRMQVHLGGNSYKINTGLNLKYGNYSIKGAGSTLDFTSLSSGSAITISGVLQPSYPQSRVKFEGFELIGQGKSSSVTGINCDSAAAFALANASFSDISIHHFGVGIALNNRTYITSWYNVNVYECGIDLSLPEGAEDSGENHRFVNCAFFNSDLFLDIQQDANIRFFGCSIDYNLKNVTASAGICYFDKCHIEGRNYTGRAFDITDGQTVLNFNDCNLVCTDVTVKPDYYFYIEPSTEQTRSIRMDNCFINNLLTSSGELCGGCNANASRFETTRMQSYWQTNMPPITNRFNNLLSNGSFENEDLTVDDVYIARDVSYPPIFRFNGGNLTLSDTLETSYTGGLRSLKIAKTGVLNSAARVDIGVKCKPDTLYKVSFAYKQLGSSSGMFLGGLQSGKIITKGDNLFLISNGGVDYSAPFTPTTQWQKGEVIYISQKTTSADTHICLYIDMYGWGVGTLYIDDVIITAL